MLFNEPYLHLGYFKPELAAEHLRKVFIPAADALGYGIASPTFHHAHTDWTAEFLVACYLERNNEEFPCDVTKITKFAMHDYYCFQSFWKDTYEIKHYKGGKRKLGRDSW